MRVGAFKGALRTCVFVMTLPLALVGCRRGGGQATMVSASSVFSAGGTVTNIAVTNTVIQSGAKRLGMNLGGQNFYDSGQMLKNLVYINPGFEGETWQSILRCEGLTATSCADPNQWNQWPADFLKGATFEVISGLATGETGTVLSSMAADPKLKDQGVTIKFAALSKPLELDDFVLVRQSIPGDAEAGWWINSSGGGSFATEYADLPPGTAGKQALKMLASGVGQMTSVSSYFDSTKDHSFVQLKGTYRLAFRARGLAGNRQIHVGLRRSIAGGDEVLLSKAVALTNGWHDYSFDIAASEDGSAPGTVGLTFDVNGADVLLDDVSLTPVGGAKDNPTVFRDEVVSALRALHPGVLRYQDGDHLGSSIDNLIAPVFGRVRAGFSEGASRANGIPVGLPEFLRLCQAVGAEPWFNMPAGMSQGEMRNLVEYLAGSSSSLYGSKRAAMGQVAAWTTVFPVIHLELGNEEWNGVTFAGASMADPVAYGERAKAIFAAARGSQYYQAGKFDLVIGTFAPVPDWTERELAASGGYDSTAVAPYLFNRLDDAHSDEAVFGPMLAQPEMMDSASGYMAKQARAAKWATRPAKLSVYEVNLSTTQGSASQKDFDRAVPSMGAGLAVVDHMLLMMRDLGVTTQMLWALPGFVNGFQNSEDHTNERTPLFGTVVDMGGATNLKRPQFLAAQLANTAILPTMVETRLTGANPTWVQKKSANDDVQFEKAHELQTFAFAEGVHRSLVVLNLSRTEALPVTFSGPGAPIGNVSVSRLGARRIDDTNETQNKVTITDGVLGGFNPKTPYAVPPFSMTVLRWDAK